MQLTKQQIEHIAKLARLELTEEELKKYGAQLSGVLDYIGQLNEVNTDGVEPTAQVTGLENIFRQDAINECAKDIVNDALHQAPELEGRQIKVKRVLE